MTGLQVFEVSMSLMDALVSGIADVSDNTEYKNRSLTILNLLIPECYRYSATKTVTAGERPVPTALASLSSTIDLDDALSRTVLPYGLAAHLVMEESPTSASFFQQRYEETLRRFRDVPRDWEEITDEYGGLTITDEVE